VVIKRIKPAFWDHADIDAGQRQRFNFRRKWMLLVALTSMVTLTPLAVKTWVDYRLTRSAIESEALEQTAEMVTHTWRTVAYFLSERESAMQFVVRDNTLAELSAPERLAAILENLHKGLGGFLQLAVVDDTGGVLATAGHEAPVAGDRLVEEGLRETLGRGIYFHTEKDGDGEGLNLVIGVTSRPMEGPAFVLRAVVDPRPLRRFLYNLMLAPEDDAFIVDRHGRLVTPPRHAQMAQAMIEFAAPDLASATRVATVVGPDGHERILGYAHIPQTALMLIVDRPKTQMARLWFKPRLKLIGFLMVSILVILAAIISMATFLLNRIHQADLRRIMNLHQAEHANKLAGIGRLASGVAHEINNPLAVINEKIGLIRDLLTLKCDAPVEPRLLSLIDDAARAVMRATTVTRRLLNFARHMDAHVERFALTDMLQELIGFLAKEAERRCVAMQVSLPEPELVFETDRGHLQQILLNLFNNALEAMPDGGRFNVAASRVGGNKARIVLADTGPGISEEDLKRIFDPFYTNKTSENGTGLGLSVTYSLVKELDGDIQVFSQVDEGTRFELLLPLEHAGNKAPEVCPIV
jgi:two-component system, NtrC family, sensor kinase